MSEAKEPPHLYGRVDRAKHVVAPLRSFNPTKRYIPVERHVPGEGKETYAPSQIPPRQEPEDEESRQESSPRQSPPPRRQVPGAVYVWRSRDNRKGRHGLAVGPEYGHGNHRPGPRPTTAWQESLRGIGKMFTRCPVWDISYDVGIIFTIGSVIWVINGSFSWLPLVAPSTEFHSETTWAAGLTAFIGATVFEFGSILLMLEAVNEHRSDCFGWAVEETAGGWFRPHHTHECRHHQFQRRSFLKGSPLPPQTHKAMAMAAASDTSPHSEESVRHPRTARTWTWWPTWHELQTHYIREIGFLACLAQMFGATVFWISGFTAIPSILDGLSVTATNGVYWLPQVIGGVGFIVSSLLFMLEVQPRWYVPAPGVLGWHIGLWNFVGSIGFTVCGAIGFGGSRPAIQYALTLASYIGSWAFLIGSTIQWFESLSKYPLWVDQDATAYALEANEEASGKQAK